MARMAAVQKQPLNWEPALVQRAREGDVRAFERLYRQNVDRVYALCMRLTHDSSAAEDCTQEAFINAWRSLGRFEVRSAFGTWMHRIAVNVVLGRRRTSDAWTYTAAVPVTEIADTAAPDWTFDTAIEVEEIERAIGELPEGARDVLVLSGIYGYSHQETAQMLGVAEGSCKAQLHRARAILRRRLQRETPS